MKTLLLIKRNVLARWSKHPFWTRQSENVHSCFLKIGSIKVIKCFWQFLIPSRFDCKITLILLNLLSHFKNYNLITAWRWLYFRSLCGKDHCRVSKTTFLLQLHASIWKLISIFLLEHCNFLIHISSPTNPKKSEIEWNLKYSLEHFNMVSFSKNYLSHQISYHPQFNLEFKSNHSFKFNFPIFFTTMLSTLWQSFSPFLSAKEMFFLV